MPATRLKIFISSVQKELATERRAVKDFITHDPLLSRFISDVFLFEDIPAGDRMPDDLVVKNIFLRVGEKRGSRYILAGRK